MAAATVVALAIVGAPVAVLVSLRTGASTASSTRAPQLRLVLEGHELARIGTRRLVTDGRVDRVRLGRALRAVLAPRVVLSRGRGRVSYRIDIARTTRRALDRAVRGGIVRVAGQPFASMVSAPATPQLLRNNCETASLSILLATTGLRVSQLRLQRELGGSGPLDPVVTNGGTVWGDPEVGFVGRAAGGGTAGGFGVYERPILALARAQARTLENLTGQPLTTVYARLLSGRAVMTWIGLSDGPYRTWTSPAGRRVRVNFGEHVVVLNGVFPNGDLRVVNPLAGTRERWTRGAFELMWGRLGRRALAG